MFDCTTCCKSTQLGIWHIVAMACSSLLSLALILTLGHVGAADIAINGVPIRLQEDANKIIVTTNVTANASATNASEVDKARLNVPGSADIRLQLQPDGLSDGGDATLCQGRKCPSTAAVEQLVDDQARTLNSTWDVLVEEPLNRAKDALLAGLSQAWGRLRDGFSTAGDSIKQAANATVRTLDSCHHRCHTVRSMCCVPLITPQANAAKSAAGGVSGAVQGVAQGIKDGVKAVGDFFGNLFG